jgi:hypothetical protein
MVDFFYKFKGGSIYSAACLNKTQCNGNNANALQKAPMVKNFKTSQNFTFSLVA